MFEKKAYMVNFGVFGLDMLKENQTMNLMLKISQHLLKEGFRETSLFSSAISYKVHSRSGVNLV